MALGFISCIALLVLADGITKERKFSEEENRMLATKPKASVETVMSGKFMSQYEKYKSDQFLGRDFWVSLKTKADLLLGKKDSNGVFKGADGYLLEEISVLDEASYKENMDAVTAFAARYPDLKMHMLIAPNAANILKEKLPAFAATEDQNAQLKRTEEIVSGYERSRRENSDIYLPEKNDTEVVVNYVEEKEKSASMYSSEKLEEKDKYGMFLNGNHALVDIKTTSGKNRRLLILKDSYANCFVPFLTPYYREIVLVDPRYYYGDLDDLIEEDRITDVLFLYNGNTFFTDNNLSGVLASE